MLIYFDAYEIFATLNSEKSDVEILQKYNELTSLPKVGQRQQAFRKASPFDKAQIWKAQIIYFLATARINKAQQDFFLEIVPLLSPKAFDLPLEKDGVRNEETRALDALEPKAKNLFSKEEAFVFFMGFGVNKMPSPQANFVEEPPIDLPPGGGIPTCECNCPLLFSLRVGGFAPRHLSRYSAI